MLLLYLHHFLEYHNNQNGKPKKKSKDAES